MEPWEARRLSRLEPTLGESGEDFCDGETGLRRVGSCLSKEVMTPWNSPGEKVDVDAEEDGDRMTELSRTIEV